MKTIHVTDYRSHHDVLTSKVSKKELKEIVNKEGKVTLKVLFALTDIMKDENKVKKESAERITGSETGLSNVELFIAGRTTKNEVIMRVTGIVEFETF